MSARIRLRPRITKKHVFFLPSTHIRLLPIFEKKLPFSGDKKNILKKNKFISVDKKYFSSYVFFLLVFFLNMLKKVYIFFISSPSLTFQEGKMFFFPFSKIG